MRANADKKWTSLCGSTVHEYEAPESRICQYSVVRLRISGQTTSAPLCFLNYCCAFIYANPGQDPICLQRRIPLDLVYVSEAGYGLQSKRNCNNIYAKIIAVVINCCLKRD